MNKKTKTYKEKEDNTDMQPMKNEIKHRVWLRCIAVVLLIACVTVLVPSSVLAEKCPL